MHTNYHANLDDGLLSGEYLEEPLRGDPLDPRHCGDPPLAPLGDPPLGDSLLALKEVHISKIKQGCKINLKFIFLPLTCLLNNRGRKSKKGRKGVGQIIKLDGTLYIFSPPTSAVFIHF